MLHRKASSSYTLANLIRRRLFLRDTEKFRFFAKRSKTYFPRHQAHLRKSPKTSPIFCLKPMVTDIVEEARKESKARIVALLRKAEETAERMSLVGQSPREQSVPTGYHDINVPRSRSKEYHLRPVQNQSFATNYALKPPRTKAIYTTDKWDIEVEDHCRLQQAGYENEIHYWMKTGRKVERWSVSGFIKSLVAKDGRLIKFSPAQVCTNPRLVRLYEYDIKFIQSDAEKIALFRTRFDAAQKEAQKTAETARIKLIQESNKSKKKAAHKEQKLKNKQAREIAAVPEGETSAKNVEPVTSARSTRSVKKPKKRSE